MAMKIWENHMFVWVLRKVFLIYLSQQKTLANWRVIRIGVKYGRN